MPIMVREGLLVLLLTPPTVLSQRDHSNKMKRVGESAIYGRPMSATPTDKGGCWSSLGDKNIPDPISGDCKHRYQSLHAAMKACQATAACQGVTRDGGVHCRAERSEHTSIWEGGFTPVFMYDLRKGKAGRWPGGIIKSWSLDRTKQCSKIPEEEHHFHCKAQASSTVAETKDEHAQLPAGPGGGASTVEDLAEELPPSAAFERRSAEEIAEIDLTQIARGLCPRCDRAKRPHPSPSSPHPIPQIHHHHTTPHHPIPTLSS